MSGFRTYAEHIVQEVTIRRRSEEAGQRKHTPRWANLDIYSQPGGLRLGLSKLAQALSTTYGHSLHTRCATGCNMLTVQRRMGHTV